MEIPNLPTDKFYKFITVSGLAIILASMTFIFILQEKTKRSEELVLAAGHDVRAYYLNKKIERLLQRNPSILLNDSIGIELASVENANLFAREEEARALFYKVYTSRIDSLDHIVVELNDLAEKAAIEEVSFLVKDRYFIDEAKDKQLAEIFLTACCIVGILSCFWGFKMWYRIEVRKKKK